MLNQKIAIPTYFDAGPGGDDDWSAAASAGPLLALAIINPASGPGYTSSYLQGGAKHAQYQQRLDQLHAVGTDVLGYVTTNYRDSGTTPGTTSVQAEHRFTVEAATNVVMTRNSSGAVNPTGWTTGFGPIRVRSKALPSGLAPDADYFWIEVSPTTGSFATSPMNATAGLAAPLNSPGDPGPDNTNHAMGLSRIAVDNVIFEIDTFYARWPNIDGMFFDEMNKADDELNIAYYKKIFDHVRTKGGKALVVQNPGATFPESMIGIADTFMAFESSSSNYQSYVPPTWQVNYPPTKFWHAVHSCPDPQMPKIIETSRQNKAGYIYVTDRVHPDQNVWLHIASNFSAEVAKVASENSPPAVEIAVPHLQELRPAMAADKLQSLGLQAEFRGTQGPNAWVWRQSPRAGTTVARGTKVILQIRNGPIP